MKSLALKRAFKEFSTALWRNRWISLGTILAMAMVFFLTWLVFTVNDSSQLIIDRVEQKVDVGVFFQKEASDFMIESFLDELEILEEEGKIKSFASFSKEEALAEMKEKFPSKVRFLERYQFENPLQDSVEIVPDKWSPDQVFTFLEEPRFDEIIDRSFFERYEEKKEEVNRILRLLSFMRQGGLALVTIFLVISALLIAFFVSSALHQKKREILIMRLVGAAPMYIRLPFILQGISLAVLGFLLSFTAFRVFLETIAPNMVNFFTSVSDQTFISDLILEIQADFTGSFWWSFFLLLILSGMISFATVERFLRKRHLLEEK